MFFFLVRVQGVVEVELTVAVTVVFVDGRPSVEVALDNWIWSPQLWLPSLLHCYR